MNGAKIYNGPAGANARDPSPIPSLARDSLMWANNIYSNLIFDFFGPYSKAREPASFSIPSLAAAAAAEPVPKKRTLSSGFARLPTDFLFL